MGGILCKMQYRTADNMVESIILKGYLFYCRLTESLCDRRVAAL